MATNTTNYGWTKPDYEDDADIAVFNETFDAIDAQVKTVETALDSKQTALSTAQLAAVNSGITSESVAQIETNKNNISTLTQYGGGINVFDLDTITGGGSGITATANDDSSVTINGKLTTAPALFVLGYASVIAGKTYYITGCPTGGGNNTYRLDLRQGDTVLATDTGNGTQYTATETQSLSLIIRVAKNYQCTNLTFFPMVSKDDNAPYQPYAMSNAELTAAIQALQAQLANQ